MFDNSDELLKINEVCRYLKIGKNTCYDLIHENKINAIRIGRSFRITQKSLKVYLENNQVEIK